MSKELQFYLSISSFSSSITYTLSHLQVTNSDRYVNTEPSFWSSRTDMLCRMWILCHHFNGNELFGHFNCTSRVHVVMFSNCTCWVHVVCNATFYISFLCFQFNCEMQVSVPSSSLSMVVTVKCGHCTSVLSVNMMKASFVPFHLLASLSHLEVIGYLYNSMFVSFVLFMWVQRLTYLSLIVSVICWIFNLKCIWDCLHSPAKRK